MPTIRGAHEGPPNPRGPKRSHYRLPLLPNCQKGMHVGKGLRGQTYVYAYRDPKTGRLSEPIFVLVGNAWVPVDPKSGRRK